VEDGKIVSAEEALTQALRRFCGSMFSLSHFRQLITPRNVQMMQMKVPQLIQG
jgi:hypothetical protein